MIEAPPTPSMRGIFSIYDTPDGGYHISYRLDGDETDRHQVIPAFLVRLAQQGAETGQMPGPIKLLKALKKAGHDG